MENNTSVSSLKQRLETAVPAVVFALLIIQPLLDAISHWATEWDLTVYTTFFRLAMFAAVMLYGFFITDRKKLYLVFAAVILVYYAAHFVSCMRSASGYISPFQDFANFFRTVHLPLFALVFITFFKKSNEIPRYVQIAFIINLAVMLHIVILSRMTGTPRYTYTSARMGLMGWASVSNSQSAILAFVVPLILLFVYKMKNGIAFYAVSVVCFANLFFCGTKVDYFSILIIAAGFIVMLILTGEKRPLYYIVLGVTMVATLLCFKTSVAFSIIDAHDVSMEEKQGYVDSLLGGDVSSSLHQELPDSLTKEEYDSLNPRAKYEVRSVYGWYLKPMIKTFGFERVFDKYNGSLDVTVLSAARQQKRFFAEMAWEDATTAEKLFGFEYSTLVVDYTDEEDGEIVEKQYIYDLENDLPSVFYFSGYVGTAIYLAFAAYFVLLIAVGLITRFKKLFNLESAAVGITLVLIVAAAQFSGNVLRRPNVSIYVSAMLAYSYYLTAIRENVKIRDIFGVFKKKKV